MFKSLLSFALKLLIAIAPFTIVPWLLKESAFYPWLAGVLGKDRDSAKAVTIGVLSAADLVVLTAYEIFSRIIPQRDARQLGQLYIKAMLDAFEAEATTIGLVLGEDIRINVMFAKRLPVLLFVRRFVWYANRGFGGGHRDNRLSLFTWQGLCGKAFRARSTLGVDLRRAIAAKQWYPSAENFWLFPWQLRNTGHLRAIISIPIFWEIDKGQLKWHKTVGVINLDAISDAGADGLLSNKTRLDTFFKHYGKILAICSAR